MTSASAPETPPSPAPAHESPQRLRFAHVAEYILMRALSSLIMMLPYRGALLFGWLVAGLSFCILRQRVAEAQRRVRAVFGAVYSERQVRRIVWLSWRNFVFCVVDMIKLRSITMDWLKVHLSGWESSAQALKRCCPDGRGGVIVCPHMGAWEMAGVAMQVMKFPMFFLTGRQKNPIVDAYINRLRSRTGIDTVQRGSSMIRGVLKRLKDGHILAFLPDVRSSTEGIKVRFLGGEANVAAGAALFARQTDVPIIPAIVTRIGWTTHTIHFCEPILPDSRLDKKEDWQRMTQNVFDVIDDAIRKHPEQWFWFNKRWILDPL
ncbi:MAG: lysophospholipid acyltransferase family protein [bacterium]